MTGTTTDIRPGVSEKNLIVCLNGPDLSDVPISNFKVQPSRTEPRLGIHRAKYTRNCSVSPAV